LDCQDPEPELDSENVPDISPEPDTTGYPVHPCENAWQDDILTENYVGNGEAQDVDAVNRQRHKKQIEIAVVTTTDTVADPRTVMVEPLCEQHAKNDYNIQKINKRAKAFGEDCTE